MVMVDVKVLEERASSVVRQLLFIACILLIPIVPFVLFHDSLEGYVQRLQHQPLSPLATVSLVVGLLSSDILLPIPSSLVSTLAGSQLSVGVAALASWLGMNLGAAMGFGVSRRWGHRIASRLVHADDLARMEAFGERQAAWVLVLTRALPILAEAAVVWLGAHRVGWRQFWPPVLLSNLGIAIAYSWLGHWAADREWLVMALSVSVALPLLVTIGLRRYVWRISENGSDSRPCVETGDAPSCHS